MAPVATSAWTEDDEGVRGLPAYSADPQLAHYWVSGIDGSFPRVPPANLTRYYSIGKTRPFVGDIMQPGTAQRAFEACSYRKEIILMCTDVGNIWFEFVFGQIMMLRERGYSHIIIYMDSKEHCETFQKHMPSVCCLYSSIFLMDKGMHDFWTPLGRLWTIRWMVFAKALQLGYNMLHIDNDVMLTQDIYRYLKHPIFMEYQLMALGTPALVGINCGVVYAHNAHPAGPSSWTAYQVPDRTLRWLENEPYILPLINATNRRHKLQDIGFEQSVYNDAVWAIVSGQPFFGHSLRPDWDPRAMGEWERYHKQIGPDQIKRVSVQGPPEWAAITQQAFSNDDQTVQLRYYDTQLVASGPIHDPRLGPEPFPPTRGPLSLAVQRFMAEGAPELWPNWESAAVDAQVLNSRREKFLLAPGWLMGGWNKDGWHGYWHIDQPHVIMAHMVGMGGKHQHGKRLGYKVAGWWHFEATKMLYGNKLFWSSTDQNPLPRLLVLDPSILVRANSQEELMRMHYGLVVAGLMAQRVWVWPPLDCRGKRARQSGLDKHWAGVFDSSILYYGGPKSLKCLDLTLTWNYCMEKGMSWPDFQEYRKHVAAEVVAQTGVNTIRLDGPQVSDSGSAPDSTPLVAAQLGDLRQRLGSMDAHQVVYISSLFALVEDGTPCVPRCDYDRVQPGLVKRLQKFEHITGCYPFNGRLLPKR